jgi:hypothetical protein
VTTTLDVIDPNDGLLSLREAVLEANASTTPTKITVPAGTYVLRLEGYNEGAGATGDLDLTGDISIDCAGADATIIDGNRLDRVLEVHEGTKVTVRGVTIRGGDVTRGSGDAGGGIVNFGDLKVVSSTLTDNSAADGGGIFNFGTLEIRGTVEPSSPTTFLGRGAASAISAR